MALAAVSSGTYGSEFFFRPELLNCTDFEEAFAEEFPESRADFIDLVPDAHGGDKLYQLWIPTERKDEIMPWLKAYCTKIGHDLRQFPSDSGFGWSHGG